MLLIMKILLTKIAENILYIECIYQQAFAKLVRMEQEQAEKDRKKEEEERRRKREAEKRKKRILEAAFDGDNDEILSIINEVCYFLI